jgi:hypothetical protein
VHLRHTLRAFGRHRPVYSATASLASGTGSQHRWHGGRTIAWLCNSFEQNAVWMGTAARKGGKRTTMVDSSNWAALWVGLGRDNDRDSGRDSGRDDDAHAAEEVR